MPNIWKGPGCLLIKGGKLIKPGQEIPEGMLSNRRIDDLGTKISRPIKDLIASPVVDAPPLIQVASAPIFKRGPGRPPKVGPKDRDDEDSKW
jgi:hypothetical protein